MATERSSKSGTSTVKAQGAVYTPPLLSQFVADRLLRECALPSDGPIDVLDPAMGDGALLDALLGSLSPLVRARCVVHGYDTDAAAVASGTKRLHARHPDATFDFSVADFLEVSDGKRFDIVIANPPYVRTQVMGSKQSKLLAQKFGLTGRVDLYYPFMLAIASSLAPSGTAAIITSNRFLTTKSGQVVRKSLPERFRLRHIYDLGDTKLFDAAVLPAITIANGLEGPTSAAEFTSIYATKVPATCEAGSVIEALDCPDGTVVSVSSIHYHVKHGVLEAGKSAGEVWRIGSESGDEWLSTVQSNTWNTFDHVGKIRVGVKSTADKIFIRSDWDVDGGEPELLKPLLTRHHAQRYRSTTPSKPKDIKRILYPHTTTPSGKRATVDLDLYPRAKAYLESHRTQLEKRTYLIEAKRKWFEVWVPQDPGAWKYPKLVFTDISEKPSFWMDLDGAIVNGECYFLRNENESDPELLWLAMAVANSSFIEKFYDSSFNNKLYAGRRRWVTQYVEKFPLPDPTTAIAREIIASAKELHRISPSEEADVLAKSVDALIWEAFGLAPE